MKTNRIILRKTRKNKQQKTANARRSALAGSIAMLAASALSLGTGSSANAATFLWDADATAAGNLLDGTGLGGAGTWDAVTANWWDGVGTDVLWANLGADIAIFTGPYVAGSPVLNTVTVSSGILANQVRFNRSGYTLSGGDITLSGAAAGLHANLGETATISSLITGSAGLTKTGGGSIRLTNASNNYTGTTTIANGSLIINSAAALGGTGTVSILTTNNTPLNNSLTGLGGGSLVLDGTAGGFTFSRDVNFEGRGPIGERGAAILSLGNNTLSGTLSSAISPLPLSPTATIRNSRVNSVNGTLTISNTLNVGGTSATTVTNLGGVNAAGVGNFNLTGVLTGTGSIEKSGAGTLFLNPSSTSGFSGTVRISGSSTGQQSSVRVTQASVGGTSIFGANIGTTTASAIDLNGGVLEFRSDSSLNFGALASGKNVYTRSTGNIFTGPAAGGAAINGTTTLGALQHVISTTAATATTTFNSRNGYGVTFSTMAMDASTSTSTLTNTLTNNMGGDLTFTGNITLGEGNTASRPRVLAVGGGGNTVIQGSVIAGTDPGKDLTKSGAGNLTIRGVGTTVAGTVSITAGAITATDFRSLNNNAADISLGNATTTGGNLIIGGTGVAPTLAGLITSKTITLNTTSGSNSIYANQTGLNPVTLNGAITKIAAATTGALILGGTNAADNIINVVIPVEPTPGTGGVTKLGSGTWVLNNANSYLGATTVQNGTLKLRATAAASDVIPATATNTVVFSGNATTGTAGGILEFRGFAGAATTETLGALTPTAGAATIRLLGNGGSAADLTFTSLGATAAASSVNFDTSGAIGGVITLTGQAATTATTLPGTANFLGHLYLNGADFATINGSAQVVAPTYAGAGDFQNAAGALAAAVHNKLTGSFTNGAATVSSLVTNSQTLTLSGNLVVSTGGILQSGGSATIQSDSATPRLINQTGTAGRNVAIRVDGASDVLNLGTLTNPVNIGSFTTGGLTKNGAGTLDIFGANAQTGTTNINEGTVRLSGAAGRLSATSAALVIRQGATLELNGTTGANATVATLDGAGTITNVDATAITFTQTGGGTWNGIFEDGAGVLNVTKAGTTGAPVWSGLNTYTGVTTIGGTTGLVTVDVLANGGPLNPSGIGSSSSAASNLVFAGTSSGLVYRGSIIEGALTLGSRSASTDRLFTLAGTGATLSSTAINNNAIVWSNPGDIVHGIVGPQALTFTGTSAGDNTFNPRLTDSGAGVNITSVTKTAAGQWNLGATNNTYTGATSIQNGILALNDNGALPANSPVVLGATTTSGILQMSGAFARNLTATPTAGTGTVTWGGTTGGGGFAAHATALTVTLDGGAGLIWGSGGFVGTGGAQSLIFNSASALSDVTFTNAIDLGAAVRTITVNDNGNTGADYATMIGGLSGAGGGLLKNGTGILRLTGASSYTGTTAVEAGTLVVTSLGSSTGGPTSSVGAGGVTMDNTNAVVLGNATTTGGILQYVGAGETSDRKIRLRGTTAGNQIHADGSGALILTNVAHDTTETGSKTLSLRGTNTAGNRITSVLSDNGLGNVLTVSVDGGATWILTNPGNNYTGNTSVGAGALGIGDNSALGTVGTLVLANGNVFAYGADRTIANAVTHNNNTTNGFLGDYSLTFSAALNLAAGANNVTTNNSIVAGEALIFNGGITNTALTANRTWTIDGPGETVINGNFSTSTAFGFAITKVGNGTLTLGTSGAGSNWNQANAVLDVDRGTLRFTANEAINSSASTFGGLTISPEVATTDTATVDLNGTTQTINTLTATTDGTVVVDNTAASAATFRFGANDSVVNFGSGLGSYTITDSGAGALSIVKLGNTSTTFSAGLTLTYQGTTRVEGGGLTVASPVNGTTGLAVVNSGSTLALTGGITTPSAITSVVVENGATLSLLDGAGNQLSGLTSLQLGSTAGTMTTLNFNVGDVSIAGDELNTDLLTLTAGTPALFAGNQITFNLTDTGLNASQTYDLINAPSGLITGPLVAGDWLLGATPGGFSSISITALDNRVFITTGTLITGVSYWRGVTNTTWNANANNWSQDKAGTTPALSTPGQGTDVIFAYDGVGAGALVTTLEQNFKVNSLTFEAGATTPVSVTIDPGTIATNRIEIAPQVATDGIRITAGGPATATISGPVRLGGVAASQTWTVADAGSVLSLGALQGERDVTKAGPGRVTLSAAADATFNSGVTSDFTINAGALELLNAGALGTVANSNLATVTVNSTGAFYYNGAAGTVANNLTLAGGTLSAGTAAQTYSGTVNVSAGSFVNLRNNNSAVLTDAARNITLTGVVSGAGSLTLDSVDTVSAGNQFTGTLTFGNAANTWSGDLIVNRGTATFNAAASPTFAANNITFNQLGRTVFQGTNGNTLNRTGSVTYTAGALSEFHVDNTSGVLGANYTVNQGGAVAFGSGGTGATARFFLADVASAINLSGPVTLGGNTSISVAGGDADSFLTISGNIGDGGGGYGLAINDDAGGWAQANTIVRLTGANSFTGNVALGGGTLEFDTVTNISGGASALGNGTAITSTANGVLRFIGTSAQATDRPVSSSAGVLTLSANGATPADSITYNGAITVGPAGDGTQLTLAGLAGSTGIITGGITQTGDAADMVVSGATWTHQTGTSRVADVLTVTGATTILNLNSGLFQVRNDLVVTAGANLNLNGTGALSFSTATLSADASLRATAGGIITLGANNAVVVTDFDGLRIGTDAAGVGTLNMGAFNQQVAEFILGNRNLDRSGIVNGTGTLTVTGNLDLYGGTIHANLASSGANTLEKIGAATVTLRGDNSGLAATGATIVYDGILNLDYTASNTTKLRAASQLDLRGARVNVVGNNGAATVQSVGSLTLASGGSSTIQVTGGTGQDAVLNLGAITRGNLAQDGTVRFNLPSGLQTGTNGITTTSPNSTFGLLGTGATATSDSAYATVEDGTGTWFATASLGNIVPLVSTAKNNAATWVAGDHITDATGGFTGTACADINSLRFDAAAGSDLVVAPGGTLRIGSGGLLVTSNVGGTPSVTGGTLVSGATEIVITQDSAQVFEIGSAIRGNSAVTKTGTGTLRLSGNNGYTGLTEIQEGTLQVAGSGIGDSSIVTLSASRPTTLELLADETIGRLQGGARNTDGDYGTVAVGTNTLTFNQSTSTTYAGFFTGTGSVVMNSGNTGNLNLSNISSGFTGSVVLGGGLLQLSGIGQVNASAFTINRGGNLLLDNNTATRSGTRIVDTASITLNSADGAFSGTTIPRGLAIRTDQDATLDETVGLVTLNTGASYVGMEATTTNDDSDIIVNNLVRLNSATLNVRGTNLGGASAQENEFRIGDATNQANFIASAANLVGGGGAAATQNISIVPWAIGQTTGGALAATHMGNSLVTYVSGSGFRPLDLATEYDTIALAAANDNARESLTGALAVASGPARTVNALVLHNASVAAATHAVTGAGAGESLAVTSGALLFTLDSAAVAGNYGLTLGGFDSGITVGATNEYVIHVVNPDSGAPTKALTATISSPLTSAADITKSGRGTLILSGLNTAGGGANRTTINEGVLQIADLDNIGGATGGLVFAGGTLRLGAAFADDLGTRTVSLLGAGGTMDDNGNTVTLAMNASGAGALTKIGAGTVTLTGLNTYTGGTNLTAGSLVYGAGNALADSGAVTVSGGSTLDIATFNDTVGAVTLVSGNINGTSGVLGGASYTVQAGSISAILGGAGSSLTKDTAGAVTISSVSTYTGSTTVNNGTLTIGSGASINGTSAVTVNGGTLAFSGNHTHGTATTGQISVMGGGALSLQDGAINILTLAGASGTNLALGDCFGLPSALLFDINASLNTTDQIVVGQNLMLDTTGSTVSLNTVAGSILADGTYSLATYLGTSTLDGAFTFTSGAYSQIVGGGKSYSLLTNGTSLDLVVGSYALAPGAALYFKGAINNNWSTQIVGSTNFVNGPAGVDAFTLPDATRDVYLSANVASNLTTDIGGDVSVRGLIFTGTGTQAASNNVSVTGDEFLTTGLNGITVQSGSGVNTISAILALGANQTWTNNSGNGNPLNIASPAVVGNNRSITLAGTDPINISSIINLASSISYTGESTGTLSGIAFGSGNVSVASTGASTVWGSLAFWPVNAGQLTVSGSALHTGSTTVTSGTLRLDNGLTSSSGLAIGDDTLVQAQGTISVPVTTPGANAAGSIQAVGTLVLQNSSGAFNFAGLIDAQGNLVQVVAPVRSTLDFINLENGANISAGNGLKVPDGDGGSTFSPGTQKGMIILTGSATIGGDIQLGTVSGDAVDVVGISGTDTLTFTGVIRGGISAPGVTIDLSGAVNLLGFSPSFNPFTSSTLSAISNTFEVDTNAPYGVGAYTTTNGFPQPKPSPIAVDGSNYTQYLAYGYTQISGTGTNNAVGLITIPAHAGSIFNWAGASSGTAPYTPSEGFTIIRTDGHNWPTYTSSGNTLNTNRNGTYRLEDGSIAGFAGVTIASFAGLPALPAGQTWQVESTNKYLRLYVQGFLPMGSGAWKNGGGDQLWTTNSAANNNWGGGQPSSVGQIATFDNTVVNYAGGVVNADLAQTIGGINLSDSGSGGYNLSGNTLTLTNGNILAGVVTYTDPVINVNSGAHTIANNVVIGNGNAVGANGLVVTTAPGSQVAMNGNISSGFVVGNSITKAGAGALTVAGAANTYTGKTNVAGGDLNVAGNLTATTNLNLTGGTMLLSGAGGEQVNNAATVSMAGGNIAFNNAANQIETLGNLTLSGNSVLDFGTIGSSGFDSLKFGTGTYTSGSLTILNWQGTDLTLGTDGVTDRLIFTGDLAAATAFESAFAGSINFVGFGPGFDTIHFGSGFEVVATPIPEPAETAVVGALALCALIGYRERRRFFPRKSAATTENA